ncbi:tRNA pseudouridine synthase Pus10 isoform X4 [Phyllobates terribilis]|uniref:tRNA pseudouridine synthase Pus10 isoform X4 n=1 Tax=Phyllobates terribilis TaxID=111132 RepID=UPI003CCB5F57
MSVNPANLLAQVDRLPNRGMSLWIVLRPRKMLLIEEKYKPVAELLLSSGTCPRCVLRFCSVGSPAPYRLPFQELSHELRKFLVIDGDISPPSKKVRLEDAEEGRSETQIPEDVEDNCAAEAQQSCNLCLGVLQHHCSTKFVKKIFHKVQSAGYEFQDFVFPVSLPPQLLVRESLFEVGVVFCHHDTDEDCHFLATVCKDCFKPTKNKQSVFTRMAVVKALEKIKDNDFCNHFPWPPSSPKTTCQVVHIQCNHASVFVAGRYNKYSRNLPQTPWVIDGERKMESSVEELITEQLMAVFKADSFNFSSSGREDVDVRTLGRGRPFAIELVNPHRVQLAEKDMKDLQQKINNNDKIKVRDLQIVSREAVAHMKEGEEEKTKCYSALIWTERTMGKEDLEFLNDLKELKLIQKTPLRVLHRRPLASRSRIIHTMKTEYVDEHHFRLYLKTQAGTYIKEFAHGDFGRTVPNIGSMMKTTADILELDVESSPWWLLHADSFLLCVKGDQIN